MTAKDVDTLYDIVITVTGCMPIITAFPSAERFHPPRCHGSDAASSPE